MLRWECEFIHQWQLAVNFQEHQVLFGTHSLDWEVRLSNGNLYHYMVASLEMNKSRQFLWYRLYQSHLVCDSELQNIFRFSQWYNDSFALKLDRHLRCLLNFRAIRKLKTGISRLRDFARPCGKPSVRLGNKDPRIPAVKTLYTSHSRATHGASLQILYGAKYPPNIKNTLCNQSLCTACKITESTIADKMLRTTLYNAIIYMSAFIERMSSQTQYGMHGL